jgi:uncharacterized membrane protein YdjX (TVP38/TMEM64 family)
VTASPHDSRWRLWLLLALFAGLVALSLGWVWGPMKEWVRPDALLEKIRQLRELGQGLGLPEATGLIALASFLAVPLGIIIPVTALALDPATAFLSFMSGATLGGAASFTLGSHLGHASLQRLVGERINAISLKLARRGVLSVFIIRLLPVAPFAIVNLVAGATHIRLRDFVLGTLLGMLPALLFAILFVDKIVLPRTL